MKTLPLILSVFVAGIAAFGQTKAAPSRATLEREVRHELLLIPQYGVFDFLTFNVEGSTVTLSGDARTPVVKNNAEKAVKGIPGVEKVVNKINVLPVNTADNAIRIAVYNAISARGLERFPHWGYAVGKALADRPTAASYDKVGLIVRHLNAPAFGRFWDDEINRFGLAIKLTSAAKD